MSSNSLSASGERAGVRGFQMYLYLLIHPYDTHLAGQSAALARIC
jgi:hypothetical protein